MPGGRIGFHVRAAFGKDEGFADRLEQVVREEHQEDGHRQEDDALRPRRPARRRKG